MKWYPRSSPMPEASPVFTIARIAGIIGCDRKTVREHIDETMRDRARTIMVKGQPAQAWPVDDLPASIRERLAVVAQAEGFSDLTLLLQKGRGRWMPPLPLGKIAHRFVNQAQRRCRALAPAIQANRDASISEIVLAASTAWKDRAGYEVDSERTIRRWIERAIDRDRGYEEWDRWALYLDDDVIEEPATDLAKTAILFEAARTREALERLEKPSEPSESDRDQIWLAALLDADELETRGATPAMAQKLILECLRVSRVPIAANREALRVAFRRKRSAWEAGGRVPSAITDRRPARNAERRIELPDQDRLLLLRYYLNCGDLASAFRLALKNRVLTAETLARFAAEPRDKSHVPHSIRHALASDIIAIDARKLGPRAAAMNCGYLDRLPSGEPGDWWQGDDLTPPVYFWNDTPDGVFFGRGQILMMVDVRSWCILGFCLICSNNYNARAIRALVTTCHDKHGLPRKGFYFERGIWECSRIIKGASDNQAIPFEETELGLREFGLDFIHAIHPRSKIIERIYGAIQNRMESLPGYCGRDERKDCPEKLREQIVAIRANRVHPAAHFMHRNQWVAEIERIITEYNTERHGPRAKWIPGQSPAEKYAERSISDVVHLSSDYRHLLASHRMPVTVSRNGIKLPQSLGGGRYRSEATGALVGQRVLAWIDPDDLGMITITDLDRRTPRIVELAKPVAAFAESPGELQDAFTNLAAHNRHGDTIYRAVTSSTPTEAFRPILADHTTTALGKEFREQRAAHQEARREEAALAQRFNRLTENTGIAIPKPADPNRLRAIIGGLQAPDDQWDKIKARANKDVDL